MEGIKLKFQIIIILAIQFLKMKKIILITLLICTSYLSKSQIAYVNAAASGANNGTSWADAYTDLNTAITNASGGSIWVVAGTYYPGLSGTTGASFFLKNGVQILGGFNGTEGGPTQRDPAVNVTILSGDLDQSGTWNANDAFRTVQAIDVNSTALLDGFTITGGNAPGMFGGGVYCSATGSGTFDPIIRNCDIHHNYADHGGGVSVYSWYIANGYISPQFISCKIHHNKAFGWGGGVQVGAYGSNAYCSPKFENVLLYADSSQTGGAIASEHANGGRADALFNNCTVANNPATYDVVYQSYGTPGSLTFNNCNLYGEMVYSSYVVSGNNNNVYAGNVAGWSGSGIINVDPLYMNAGANDFRLSCLSPSINAGNNTYSTQLYDLNGNPRVSQSLVDLGAYETNYTPPVVVAHASSIDICDAQSVTLYGTGANTYAWDNSVIDSMLFSPTVTTMYSVTGTDANGCTASDNITVTVHAAPIITANSSAPGVCAGNQVLVYGTGGLSYVWDNGVSDSIPFSPLVTTTYNVSGTDTYGCIGIANINITVESSTGFTAGPDVNVCRTGTPYITLTGANNGGNAFNWSTLGSGSWGNFATMTPDYYLSGADASGSSVPIVLEIYHTYCASETDTMMIYMQDPTSAYAGTDMDVCSDNTSGVPITGGASSFNSVNWSTSGTGTFVPNQVSLSTTYLLSAADILAGSVTLVFYSTALNPACPNDTDMMVINVRPVPSVSLPADFVICETDSIQLTGSITGGTPPFMYNWSNGGTISTANNEYYFPVATSNINLSVGDTYGCSASDTMLVTIDASEMLSGTIHAGASVLSDGVMYVLKFIPQQLAFDTVFVYPFSAGTGTYSFPSFPFGNYLIKIVPDTTLFPNLLPTYYGDAFQWDSATVITHNCTNPFVADINMIALLGGTGTGTISGFVKEGNGFGTRMTPGHDEVFAPGGPLKGVDIKLGKNPGGGIQARTMSDSLGHYVFSDLPDDSYRIYVDIPGLPMDSFYVVNIDAAVDSVVNLDYYADSNSVFPIMNTNVGIHAYKFTASNFEVYPNPAHNNTSVKFELQSEHTASIRLMDITGKQVMNIQLNKLPKGRHEYQLNFANQQLSSGVYFIQVMSDSGMQVKKLIVE